MRLTLVVATLIVLALWASPGRAQQALQALERDWTALDASITVAAAGRQHVTEALRAVLVEHETRLKWVLDNWVPRPSVPPKAE